MCVLLLLLLLLLIRNSNSNSSGGIASFQAPLSHVNDSLEREKVMVEPLLLLIDSFRNHRPDIWKLDEPNGWPVGTATGFRRGSKNASFVAR
jgi:hypothetical protein